MPKNTSERIIDRPLQGRQTARVWSGSSSTSSTDTSTTADALLAVDFITLNANATLTNERYLDVATGLTKTDGGAGAALTLGLNTPGTLTVSSTNVATGNHTHAITSSSAPGAAAALLASSASGNLTLPTFTASTKLTTPLIDTASGGLTISPANSTATINATTTVEGNLSVQRSSALAAANIYSAGSGGSHYPRAALHQARGAIGTETATQSADILGSLSFRGHTGSAYLTTGAAEIRGVASEAFSGSANGANLRFLTTSTGGTTLTERMRIHNSGNVSIANTTDGGFTLDVTGTGRFSSTASVGDGSTTTPGLNFVADANTGIYRSGTDAFSLVAGGTSIINVGATGASVNAAYDSTAALKVQSVANDDITLFLKQKSGQTARMWRVEDSAGQELIVLDSQGNLQSGNPGFVSGLTGWQIQPVGNAEFNNAWIRGELHASIFVMDEFHASGGTLVVAPAAKLENDATVYTTTGVSQVIDLRTTSVSGSGSQLDLRTTSVSGSGTQLTVRWVQNYFDITDPPSGHAMVFSYGDTLRCKSLGNPGVGIDLYDIWGTVTLVEDMTDYYRYYYQRQSGGSNGIIIPAGTAIISYGIEGDGRILLTADQSYAPYIDIFTSGAQPWNGDIVPHTRLGRLDGVGLPGVSGVPQYGMVTSTDLSDATAPYIINSNLQMFSYNVDSEWHNGNPTARITSGGAFKLGTDIDNASTTGLDFNPTTGALTIGSAAYPGSVSVTGIITVEAGSSGIGTFSDANLDNIANGTTYGRINNTIIGGGYIRVGSGTKDSTLNGWYFDNTEIVGQASGVDQVVMDTSGKMIAGAGALQLDRTAFHVANSVTSKGIQFYNTATFTDANKAGRLWALNGTPYSMYMTAGRSTFDGDSTNAAGQIQMFAYKSNGISGASVEISGATQIVEITASQVDVFGDINMNGYDIIDANNIISIRTTAP